LQSLMPVTFKNCIVQPVLINIDSEVSNGLIAQLSIINISGISTTGI